MRKVQKVDETIGKFCQWRRKLKRMELMGTKMKYRTKIWLN